MEEEILKESKLYSFNMYDSYTPTPVLMEKAFVNGAKYQRELIIELLRIASHKNYKL